MKKPKTKPLPKIKNDIFKSKECIPMKDFDSPMFRNSVNQCEQDLVKISPIKHIERNSFLNKHFCFRMN